MVKNVFTFITTTFAIFSLYGTSIGTISISDVILLISSLVLLRSVICHSKHSIIESFVPFLIYIVIISVFQISQSNNIFDVFLRTSRYLFYLFVLVFLLKNNYVYDLGQRVFLFSSLFAVGFIMIQAILLAVKGIYLQGYLPGLPLLREELSTFAADMERYNLTIRPRSIFGEPAHFAVYVVGCLTMILFSKPRCPKFWVIAGILSLGILLSMSSTGILCMGVIWICFFLNNPNRIGVYCILCFLILGLVLSQSFYFQTFVERMEDGQSTAGRFSGYGYVWEHLDDYSLTDILFGQGMYNPKEAEDYLAGYARLFMCFGIFGILLFLGAMGRLWKRGATMQNMLIIVFLILNIGTEVALGPYLLLYIALIAGNRGDCFYSSLEYNRHQGQITSG